MRNSPAEQLFPEGAAAPFQAAPPSNGHNARVVDASFLARLERMSTRQRIEASRRGRFTRHERAVWASRYPDEVPRVNGEFEWIALNSADLD